MRRVMLCMVILVAAMIVGAGDGLDRNAWAQTAPVSWWKGEDNAFDSADSNLGTLVGGSYMDGAVGRAFSLNGGGYVDVGDKANLNFGAGDFSIVFWVKTAQAPTGNDQKVFVNKQTSLVAEGRTGFEVMLASPFFVPQVQGTVIFVIRDGVERNGVNGAGIASTRQVNDGNWHHVAAVKTTTSLYLCVDGVLRVKPHIVTGSISTNTSFRIGELSDRTTGSHEFIGGLDEIMVYNRALDLEAELQCRLPIDIDIKPGKSPNSINTWNEGTIPVAILSSPSFLAPAAVDVSMLRFGHTGNEASLAFCNTNGEDVDGDGILDLVCHFNTQLTAFQVGDTQGYLVGATLDGLPLLGQDSVRIVH